MFFSDQIRNGDSRTDSILLTSSYIKNTIATACCTDASVVRTLSFLSEGIFLRGAGLSAVAGDCAPLGAFSFP